MKQTMAVVAFTFAMVFAIAGIIIPPLGVIDGSVLILIAQLLVFCATFLGIENYVNIIKRPTPKPLPLWEGQGVGLFKLKITMTNEKKNKWSVIINIAITTISAILSAFGFSVG